MKKVSVQGHDLHAGYWETHDAALRAVAGFAIGCDPNQLKLTILTVGARYPGTLPTRPVADTVGVDGCGQRMTYMRIEDTWVANTAREP